MEIKPEVQVQVKQKAPLSRLAFDFVGGRKFAGLVLIVIGAYLLLGFNAEMLAKLDQAKLNSIIDLVIYVYVAYVGGNVGKDATNSIRSYVTSVLGVVSKAPEIQPKKPDAHTAPQ